MIYLNILITILILSLFSSNGNKYNIHAFISQIILCNYPTVYYKRKSQFEQDMVIDRSYKRTYQRID